MPPTNPRIIVVDDNRGISNIVRASLELLGRRPRLIETQTADDALMELRVSSPDLLITAHTLAGSDNGPTLAVMAKRELAALPIIVLGNESDPVLDEEMLAQSPFQYLRTPLAPETFIRALRVALDGPEAVPQQSMSQEINEPVPMVDTDKLRPILFQLMRDVGAMAAVLADRNGKVISYEGAAGYIDRDLLASTLGPGFGSTSKILSIIGEQPRVLKYFDGDKLDVFGLAVGLHYFVTLIFDNKAGSTLGNVKRFGGNAVNEMVGVIGAETAFSTLAAPTSTQTMAQVKPEAKGKKGRRTQEMAAAVAAEALKNSSSPSKKTEGPKTSATPKMEPIENFDASLLDGLDNIDLNSAEALFSPDNMVTNKGTSGNNISFEDAMMQGIIGDVDE
jgi:CheY-like chemotaxis protein